MPWIDDHVGRGRHVAAHTRRAGAGGLVMMVRRRVVFAWQMAGGAEGIALRAQLSAVRVVAVAASDTARVHLALEERAPVVNLAALLSVAVVKGRGEERRTIMVKERLARLVALCDLAAPRVTLRADLDLAIGCARLRAYRVAGRRVLSPRDVPPFIEARTQTLGAFGSLGFLPLWKRGIEGDFRCGFKSPLAPPEGVKEFRVT